jgi:hydrogenase expression/formation protein HypE
MTDRAAPDRWEPSCPLPIADHPTVQLGHGGGGRMSQRLVEGLFLPLFSNPTLGELGDGARLELGAGRWAFSTDSYVVQPLFFPGGDIGSLAVHGTVNDLAMCGARPRFLSAAFILEEGFPIESLRRIAESMQRAAERAQVSVVTGDTKVVDRGKGDGVFITTAGIGLIPAGIDLAPQRARPGDLVLLSGNIAEHGIAVLALRAGLELGGDLQSDSAPLNGLVEVMLEAGGPRVHALRDPTRGGVASALNEIATAAGVGIRLDERSLPVSDPVRGACELFGFDPLYVANEGKCVAIVSRDVADQVLAAMQGHELGREARIVGEAVAEHPGRVTVKSSIGSTRILDMLSGEQLPRIC